jgi:hypothetical protein
MMIKTIAAGQNVCSLPTEPKYRSGNRKKPMKNRKRLSAQLVEFPYLEDGKDFKEDHGK